jgi:hypothetical protein
LAHKSPRILLPAAERDEVLRNKGLVGAYRRHEPHFRACAQQAFDLAARTLAGAGKQLHRPPESLLPESEDCVNFLTAILSNDPEWYGICVAYLGHNLGQFVQQITQLMAEYLIDVYWATLVVRSR